ncbi:unnamed protein product [Pseudo-nitzschia multistriata]|uniref:Uncharacterized protein n=1 Tax=Pseudo-nitzschia multistriata TaxID=183589 RepID=A0A448YUZ8_9STRA|nr:unnamed protein product [Pseudo-nitzschia multistriata]
MFSIDDFRWKNHQNREAISRIILTNGSAYSQYKIGYLYIAIENSSSILRYKMKVIGSSERVASWAFALVTLALSFSITSPFVIKQNTRTSAWPSRSDAAATDVHEDSMDNESRRNFLGRAPASVMSCMLALNILTLNNTPAMASDDAIELPTKEAVTECFDFIRYELNDPKGGVGFMQGRIDDGDFAGLLDFSKSYDLEFRKRRFGNAKKLLQDKEAKSKATEYANAVTFDLIGINRSCRSGQENSDSANKYLQELRDDVNKFLALETTIQVKP